MPQATRILPARVLPPRAVAPLARTARVAVSLFALWSAGAACSPGESRSPIVSLGAADFSTTLGATSSPLLVDVRTPGEFEKGHLPRALNVDWYARDFERRIAELDRSRPVFVYCLSGSRSSEAARRLAAAGFHKVYDLSGGIIAWRAAGLPQASLPTRSQGMTRSEFSRLVAGERPVLVDYFAEWCIPCRQMRPYLEALATERAASLRVERIDADDNQDLLRDLGVDTLPTLELYRDGKVVWKKTGFTSREEVVAHLDSGR